jgi:Fic/DOC family
MDNGTSTIIFSGDLPRSTLSQMAARGSVRRLATGVYTTDTLSPPERVVRREWRIIAGRLFPDATISDRSAPTAGPVDGILYLVSPHNDRTLTLPGLSISSRRGAAPQPSDITLPGGLHQAALARALIENAVPSRARGGALSRRLTRHELGEWVERVASFSGTEELNQVRDRARALAPVLGVNAKDAADLDNFIGAALGTRPLTNLPRSLRQRALGLPYDVERIERFDILATALRSAAPQNHPSAPLEFSSLPFYDAYFSNYIEGTEFTVEEAEDIVYRGIEPAGRPQDAHDVLATFWLLSDLAEMRRLADTPNEFLEFLRERHSRIMEARPDKRPGLFKERANQAGATVFVDPDLVRGTLIEGFGRLDDLDSAWEKSVYVKFLVAAVHPFDDGNGRLSRIMMNAELDAGGQSRTIIPTVFRDDYIGALRRLDRANDPSVLIDALRFANDWTSRIDFADTATVRAQLEATNAFAEEGGPRRLQLPPFRHFPLVNDELPLEREG